MKRLLALASSSLVLALAASAGTAEAAKVPLAFAPTLGANPQRTQQKLQQLESRIPASFALPATLVPLQSAQIELRFLPEMAAAFTRAGAASATKKMTWPGGTPPLCTKHAAFSAPLALLAPNASTACVSAEASVRRQLASVAACREIEQPERYVLSAPKGVVNDQTTATIESLVGLAGEWFSNYPAPDGLLPADFVSTLRNVVWKLRRGAVDVQIATARASYADALAVLGSQAACFEPTARAALVASLNELDAELGAASAHVADVSAKGKAEADQELVCLAARSRTRAALPFPSLTAEERRFVAFWLGGVYWRARGGGMIPLGSTQAARVQFCERPMRRIGELAGGATGEEAGYRVFLNIFDGWGEWFDMGTTPGGQDVYEDLVEMTNRGRQQVADPATSSIGLPFPLPLGGLEGAVPFLAAKGYDTTALMTGGLDMGPCYAYALNPLVAFRYGDVPMAPYGGPFVEGFTALGEFCAGASISLGLATTLLEGTPTSAPPTPLCAGRSCGDDGCGGSCGTCAEGLTCTAGACVACTPSCEGKSCGDDGCGGSCGACRDGGASTTRVEPDADEATLTLRADGCSCRTVAAERDAGSVAQLAGLALAAALVARRRRSRA